MTSTNAMSTMAISCRRPSMRSTRCARGGRGRRAVAEPSENGAAEGEERARGTLRWKVDDEAGKARREVRARSRCDTTVTMLLYTSKILVFAAAHARSLLIVGLAFRRVGRSREPRL